MKNWAKKQSMQQENYDRFDENVNKPPTLLLAAVRGILAVAGAMLLIAFIIWATTTGGK